MTTPVTQGQGRSTPVLSLVATTLLVAALPSCWWTLSHAHPGDRLREVALFVHLASLVIGFGAVLTVDWVGLLWATRRRTIVDVLDTATNVTVPIWVGFAGLVGSGLFLEPDLGSPLTRLKLVLVAVIGVNGLAATLLHGRLLAGTSAPLLAVSGLSALVSQLGWWGALVIGHLNSR